ncbi:solute carrier family 25 protein [archaeon]|nr:MAG: solute carrier family 25 protein [archaeon]
MSYFALFDSCIFFIPVDVVKERLQVQSTCNTGYQYRGSLDAFATILRQEGFRGLYKGYWATLFSYGPFSSIYFWIFEEVIIIHLPNIVCVNGCILNA